MINLKGGGQLAADSFHKINSQSSAYGINKINF